MSDQTPGWSVLCSILKENFARPTCDIELVTSSFNLSSVNIKTSNETERGFIEIIEHQQNNAYGYTECSGSICLLMLFPGLLSYFCH